MTTKQNDYETLTALNRDYIASVQRGDVQRFKAILADDFLCSNPDGWLIDKGPVSGPDGAARAISGLVVEGVQIRLLAHTSDA